jgi:hypothetical protein
MKLFYQSFIAGISLNNRNQLNILSKKNKKFIE